jgi:hypothetical protein
VEAILAPINDSSELEPVIAAQAREPNGGLVAMPDSFLVGHRVEVTSLAARHRLPALYNYRSFTEVGGLMSYGNDPLVNYRRSATYVHRILKGEKPSELPVQLPMKYELVIDMLRRPGGRRPSACPRRARMRGRPDQRSRRARLDVNKFDRLVPRPQGSQSWAPS